MWSQRLRQIAHHSLFIGHLLGSFELLAQVFDVSARELLIRNHKEVNELVSFGHGQVVKAGVPRLVEVGREANDVVCVLPSSTSWKNVVLVVPCHLDLLAFSPPCRRARAASWTATSLRARLVCICRASGVETRRGRFRPSATILCSRRSSSIRRMARALRDFDRRR